MSAEVVIFTDLGNGSAPFKIGAKTFFMREVVRPNHCQCSYAALVQLSKFKHESEKVIATFLVKKILA